MLLAALVFGWGVDSEVAWTDDARFYVPAAVAYAEWLVRAIRGLLTLDFSAFSQVVRDAAFSTNHEHPPVAKYVQGLGWLVFHRWTGLLAEVDACRVGITILWAWACLLVFSMVRQGTSVMAGLFAALSFAFLPRVLFHGRVETLDLAVTTFLLATAAALLQYWHTPRPRTLGMAVLWFGLALGCKHNAPFFWLACLVCVLLWEPPRLRGQTMRLPGIPSWLFALAVLSPLLTFALWPWLWSDVGARLAAYVQYHLQHYGIYFYYRGAIYDRHVAPWHAPWVMTAITVPLCVLGLAVAGVVIAGRNLLASWSGRLATLLCAPASQELLPVSRLAVFATVQGVMQLLAVSLPHVPVYGGVKLFLPAMPFLAILAGVAWWHVEREILALALPSRWRAALLVSTVLLLQGPGLVGVMAYRGFWLSYYNELAGGVRGAAAGGYERQYYDLAYPELPQVLSSLLPSGGGIAVLPNPKEYGPYFARWHLQGRLSAQIRLVSTEEADVLVLTHEQRWREFPSLQARYRTAPLLFQRRVVGVPLYSIHDLRRR